MKRFYVLLSVLLTFGLLLTTFSACKSKPEAEVVPFDDDYIDDEEYSETGSVDMFDGAWWYRETPEDTGLNIFSFEGDTVVFYDTNGNEITRGQMSDSGDGTFTMTLELFGDVECQFGQTDDSWTITTTADGALFLIGDPIDSSAAAAGYTGKWYLNGDLDEDYLQINGDGTYAIYSLIGDETMAREQGNWELRNRSNGGKSLEVDGSFSRSDFSITSDGTAIWDSDDKYYIQEGLIGSIEGDLARQTVCLFAANYWAPEIKDVGAIYLDFHEDGALTVMTLQEDGAIEDSGDGSWEYQAEGVFALTLDDGGEYTFTVDGHVLTLDDGSVFNRSSYFG
jgi:hypothetical protein